MVPVLTARDFGVMDGFDTETTVRLFRRSIDGDRAATEVLCDRIRPRLRAWAAGRLPRWARDGIDTDDLVQDALMRTLAMPGRLEPRPDFQAYLREAILNEIRDLIRRKMRRQNLPHEALQTAPSPLEDLLGREKLERFDAALLLLSPTDRELIVCRVELGMNYKEIAVETGRPSVDAARMAVSRALVHLATAMDDES